MVIKCSVKVSAGVISARVRLSTVSRVLVTARLVTQAIGGGGIVDIINQYSDVIASINAPGTYQVEVLEEITDDEDLNTATIIDTLQ